MLIYKLTIVNKKTGEVKKLYPFTSESEIRSEGKKICLEDSPELFEKLNKIPKKYHSVLLRRRYDIFLDTKSVSTRPSTDTPLGTEEHISRQFVRSNLNKVVNNIPFEWDSLRFNTNY